MSAFNIRPAQASDMNLIVGSWCAQIRCGSHRYWPDWMFDLYRDQVVYPLASRHTTVACAPNNDDQLLGYMCAENAVAIPQVLAVHMLYVKAPFRGYGIAQSLFGMHERSPDARIVHTHETRSSASVAEKYGAAYWPQIMGLRL